MLLCYIKILIFILFCNDTRWGTFECLLYSKNCIHVFLRWMNNFKGKLKQIMWLKKNNQMDCTEYFQEFWCYNYLMFVAFIINTGDFNIDIYILYIFVTFSVVSADSCESWEDSLTFLFFLGLGSTERTETEACGELEIGAGLGRLAGAMAADRLAGLGLTGRCWTTGEALPMGFTLDENYSERNENVILESAEFIS